MLQLPLYNMRECKYIAAGSLERRVAKSCTSKAVRTQLGGQTTELDGACKKQEDDGCHIPNTGKKFTGSVLFFLSIHPRSSKTW